MLRRNVGICSTDTINLAYKSLVRPLLEYACSMWDPYTATLIDTVEWVQRRAARFVKNDYGQTSSVSAMMSDLGWSSLESRCHCARLINFCKEPFMGCQAFQRKSWSILSVAPAGVTMPVCIASSCNKVVRSTNLPSFHGQLETGTASQNASLQLHRLVHSKAKFIHI